MTRLYGLFYDLKFQKIQKKDVIDEEKEKKSVSPYFLYHMR